MIKLQCVSCKQSRMVTIEKAASGGALWFWSLVWIFALGVLPLGIALGIGEWVNK